MVVETFSGILFTTRIILAELTLSRPFLTLPFALMLRLTKLELMTSFTELRMRWPIRLPYTQACVTDIVQYPVIRSPKHKRSQVKIKHRHHEELYLKISTSYVHKFWVALYVENRKSMNHTNKYLRFLNHYKYNICLQNQTQRHQCTVDCNILVLSK